MIGFYINGRLGNQMFQLAAAYSLAIHYNTLILPDERSGKYYLTEVFKSRKIYPWHWKIMHCIGKKLSRRAYHYYVRWILPIYYSIFKFAEFSQKDFMRISYEFYNIPDNTRLNGYFQSEYYFQNIFNSVSHLFEFKDIHIKNWKSYIEQFKPYSSIVALHIRLNDYKKLGHLQLGGDDLTLPLDYYTGILAEQRLENALIIVMSDEPDTVSKWFSGYSNIVISKASLENDLITLTQADVCILSHSTFSWWGAWLNKKKNKKVYIPKYFLGFKKEEEIPESIIPANWTQVEVQK